MFSTIEPRLLCGYRIRIVKQKNAIPDTKIEEYDVMLCSEIREYDFGDPNFRYVVFYVHVITKSDSLSYIETHPYFECEPDEMELFVAMDLYEQTDYEELDNCDLEKFAEQWKAADLSHIKTKIGEFSYKGWGLEAVNKVCTLKVCISG